MNSGIFPLCHRLFTVQKMLLSLFGPLLANLLKKDMFMHALAEVLGPETCWLGALKRTASCTMIINGFKDPMSGRHSCDVIEQNSPTTPIDCLDNVGCFRRFEAPDRCIQPTVAFHGPAG